MVLHLRDDGAGSGSLFEACLAQVEALPESELFAARVKVSYEGQDGEDAGVGHGQLDVGDEVAHCLKYEDGHR